MDIWFSSQNIKEERRFHVEAKLVAISSIVIGLKKLLFSTKQFVIG